MRRVGQLVTAVVVLLGVTASVSGAAVPSKATLRVVIKGGGSVSASVSGIRCTRTCSVRVRSGARLLLRATPAKHWAFVGWLGPPTCAAGRVCATRVVHARSVTAVFSALPRPGPPPPLPPPATAKTGHYTGTYSDGSAPLSFAVDSTQIGLTNLTFQFKGNGQCSNGNTLTGALSLPETFQIGADGSVSITDVPPYGTNGSHLDTFVFQGAITAAGSASGTYSLGITYGDGSRCSSSGSWQASAG